MKSCLQADHKFNTLWRNHTSPKSRLISENIDWVCTKIITEENLCKIYFNILIAIYFCLTYICRCQLNTKLFSNGAKILCICMNWNVLFKKLIRLVFVIVTWLTLNYLHVFSKIQKRMNSEYTVICIGVDIQFHIYF